LQSIVVLEVSNVYELVFTVKEVKGSCASGYRVGEKIVYKEPNIDLEKSDRVCVYALGSIMPYISGLVRKSTEKDDWIPSKAEIQCPDSSNTVIFEIQRKEETR